MHWLGRRFALAVVAAGATLVAITVPSSARGSALVSGEVVGPDVNVSVVSVISTPRQDAGLADHTVTFLITNADPRPATVDASTEFGDNVAGGGITIQDPNDPSRQVGCFGVFGDGFSESGVFTSTLAVDCEAFELAGHTSTTAVVSVTTFAFAGDAPLNVGLRVYVDDDPNPADNTAAAVVQFDGDPSSTFTTTTTSTTVVEPPASTLGIDPTGDIDPLVDDSLPETGNTPHARATALAAILLVALGTCLTGIARRRYPRQG